MRKSVNNLEEPARRTFLCSYEEYKQGEIIKNLKS